MKAWHVAVLVTFVVSVTVVLILSNKTAGGPGLEDQILYGPYGTILVLLSPLVFKRPRRFLVTLLTTPSSVLGGLVGGFIAFLAVYITVPVALGEMAVACPPMPIRL
jgi:hypothetical protein